MKNSILLLTALACIGLTSCKKEGWPYCTKANKNITEETRTLSNFSSVDFDLSGNLHITQDPEINSPEIRIRTSENIMDRIKTKVSGSNLEISTNKCVRKLEKFDAYLVVKDLNRVTLSGSGTVRGINTFEQDDIKLVLSGSGNISFDVEMSQVTVDISGSGNVDVDGTADNLDIDLTGSGEIRAFGLPAETCSIDVRGSGVCEVNVSSNLFVDISGSGDVEYMGTPSITFENNGSGSIRAK